MQRKFVYILLGMIAAGFEVLSQNGYKSLPLNDLTSFRNQAGNWRIVGNVMMDPSVDIHAPVSAPPASSTKKNRKQKTEPAPPQAVTFTEGRGILLNINDDAKKDNLLTILEHGDIDLELEVMLPKGSNSGLYLQGRYELQLMDSWGVKNAKFSDMGGIYRNWETDPSKIYMGKAPLTNAAKAPGLWQKLKVSFKAPRFDKQGAKIQNARFVSVVLNGVTIHENVEVPLPTGGPIENNEAATGPLMIQGDHGPVAIRNFRYKLMKNLEYKVSDVSYEIFHGNFKSTSDFASAKPLIRGKSEGLDVNIVDVDNAYGIRFRGNVTVPEDNRYKFTSVYSGGQKFIFNNQEIFNHPTPDGSRNDTVSMNLKAGTYPFEILSFKDASWLPPRLALFVETATSVRKPLHMLSSFPPDDDPTSAIFISPGNEPKLVRAFLDYRRDPSRRLTHTIGVGDPGGLHYVYDLRSGNLVCVWRGGFIDATPMWHDRGDGSFRPLGSPLYLTNNQALYYLNSNSDAFPDAGKEGVFKTLGYAIEESTNRPVFHYKYEDLAVEDRIFPAENNTAIAHEVTVKEGEVKPGLFYKLAEGSDIVKMNDGTYVINDHEYYIKPEPGSIVTIREINGKKELIAEVKQTVKYAIIW